MKILIVDDDVDLIDTTAYVLRRDGFNTIVAYNGREALQRWQQDRPDLVLLDLWMPEINGLDVCRQIRQSGDTPVIMLTGAADESHILQGFRSGADDYVTKPFSSTELIVRIWAVLRRTLGRVAAESQPKSIELSGFVLDVETHTVTFGGREILLTRREFRIVFMLAINAGRGVSFERLVEYTWGYCPSQGGKAMLKTHICHIRGKLGIPHGQPGHIRVVNGIGYLLERDPSPNCLTAA